MHTLLLQTYKSLIGMGYFGTLTPGVVQRNMLENPGWYTAYTPYQAEISQGRLEMLMNYQTMVVDLTGMEVANASLLDEATAAAEAMAMSFGHNKKRHTFYASNKCHPQTLDLLRTRAGAVGANLVVGPESDIPDTADLAGVLLQYPDTEGSILTHGAY